MNITSERTWACFLDFAPHISLCWEWKNQLELCCCERKKKVKNKFFGHQDLLSEHVLEVEDGSDVHPCESSGGTGGSRVGEVTGAAVAEAHHQVLLLTQLLLFLCHKWRCHYNPILSSTWWCSCFFAHNSRSDRLGQLEAKSVKRRPQLLIKTLIGSLDIRESHWKLPQIVFHNHNRNTQCGAYRANQYFFQEKVVLKKKR